LKVADNVEESDDDEDEEKEEVNLLNMFARAIHFPQTETLLNNFYFRILKKKKKDFCKK
jgi:hypothetical protein